MQQGIALLLAHETPGCRGDHADGVDFKAFCESCCPKFPALCARHLGLIACPCADWVVRDRCATCAAPHTHTNDRGVSPHLRLHILSSCAHTNATLCAWLPLCLTYAALASSVCGLLRRCR